MAQLRKLLGQTAGKPFLSPGPGSTAPASKARPKPWAKAGAGRAVTRGKLNLRKRESPEAAHDAKKTTLKQVGVANLGLYYLSTI